MEGLLQLLEHLVTYGPARNPAELEHLLALLEGLRHPVLTEPPVPVPPAPVTINQASTGGVSL